MAANIVFVDEGTIDEVVGGEDSDLDENTDNSESSEEEDDRREEDSDGEADSEEETEEDNWVLGDRIPRRLDFTADRGLNVELPNNPSFSDYFHLLFPENLFNEIASQTNKYATETIASLQRRGRLPQHSRFRNWPEDGVTAGEIKAFLAMIIAMGLVNQENIQDYWSIDEEGYDPIKKLGTIYSVVTGKFSDVWKPGKNICIDEGMIPFRGKVHFKVYNPDKPDKYGVKSYQLCDSSNGYCCRFEIYTGVNPEPPSAKGKTYDLVMRLMQPYLNVGRCLYVDNYYTSPTLFAELYRQNTGACGTARYRKVKFKDRRVFQMLSSVHFVADVEVGRNHPGIGRPITKPEIVHDYNKFMGAVDRCDQMVAYSCFRRRTMKWWKKVFFHLFSLSILNPYILYKQRTRSPVLQRTFRRELVKELARNSGISHSLTPRGRPRRSAEGLTCLQVGGHFPEKIMGTGKKSKITRACVVCFPAQKKILKRAGEKRKRPGKESSFQCSVCKVALCIQDCFQLFHTVQNYVAAYIRRHDANNDNDDAETN
ncbi:piggyBac transposable element-derived protein 4-like [Stylophora pistillata]|uniref:piggyBac transposable element-derived protein 4-like n=1 Tax=Stylophora pistillata TaxID=50429 RepID=UPI000C044046|nr:piggyBac transposable element-derived protein 4-like [Stylophora pistillata]